MSAQAVTSREDADAWLFAVLASTTLTLGMKALGALLRARLNFETGQLNPSVDHLAAGTGQCSRSVEKQLDLMRKAGVLDWEGGRGRSARRYRLLVIPAERRELESRPPAGIGHREFPPSGRGIPALETDNSRPPAGRTLRTHRTLSGGPPRAPDGAAVAARLGQAGEVLLARLGPAPFLAWFGDCEIRGRLVIAGSLMKARWIKDHFADDLDEALPGGWEVLDRARAMAVAA